ncbi:MAG: hypothetical protein WBE48_23305, partial [Xanthobacteraceae bacterium]
PEIPGLRPGFYHLETPGQYIFPSASQRLPTRAFEEAAKNLLDGLYVEVRPEAWHGESAINEVPDMIVIRGRDRNDSFI